jgi:hypothetical protein
MEMNAESMIAEGLQNLTAEDLKDGFDDWYDNALKSGAGFKTDEEKAAYLASIGKGQSAYQ